MKRRIEITLFEQERVVALSAPHCPVCQCASEWLTTTQAASFVRVRPTTIRRWLAQGKSHGFVTAGGRHRICRLSLFG